LLPEESASQLPEETSTEVEAAIAEIVEDTSPVQPEWMLLSERGEYAAAFQRLDEAGGFDGVLANGSSEELMALADVARFVGRQGRAIQALRAVTDRFQGDPNAPLAAMIIGNLLSKAGDAQGAAEAYALNRRLSPGGDFAEDALVREFDMAIADGDLAHVERLRAQYEAEFPEGRHLSDMRAEEARLLELSELEASENPGNTEVLAPSEQHSDKGNSEGPVVETPSIPSESPAP
jgi:tetratricopeptide (TPR) repeat protein